VLPDAAAANARTLSALAEAEQDTLLNLLRKLAPQATVHPRG